MPSSAEAVSSEARGDFNRPQDSFRHTDDDDDDRECTPHDQRGECHDGGIEQLLWIVARLHDVTEPVEGAESRRDDDPPPKKYAPPKAVNRVQRLAQALFCVLSHYLLLFSPHCLRTADKPYASRDFTVPSGISSTAAISGSVISSRKCRINTARLAGEIPSS